MWDIEYYQAPNNTYPVKVFIESLEKSSAVPRQDMDIEQKRMHDYMARSG
jgi:hypothetical protein